MIVTDYHPLSKTLTEVHFITTTRYANRGQTTAITEQVLWSYLVQIANALKTIHASGLAARIIDPSKILVTSKNRIRLNACAILDVVQYDTPRTLLELQKDDLVQFGRLLLSLGTSIPSVANNLAKALEVFSRNYPPALKERVIWLLGMGTPNKTESIDNFLVGLEAHLLAAFDSSLHQDDTLNSYLNRELENARIVRLLTKLGFIIDRPDYNHDRAWAETGERFPIKLFRDYVFHQCDAAGNPVLDLAHVLSCLNKLDAGVDEKMVLTTVDEQVCIVVTYREMKRAVEGAYGDLVKAARRAG
jgi:PAB-dependent poly(A)-specific ribonuclease subunit 3